MSMRDIVMTCITTRRSIRKFTGEQISEAQRNTLLEAAVWAPSGSNSQSWLFTVLQNREHLAQLNELLRQRFLIWTPDDEYPSKKKAKIQAQNEGHSYFHRAPTLIVASNVPGYQNGMADCAAALQNIFLAARAMGLGSCWSNQLRWLSGDAVIRGFLAELGLPGEHIIYGAAAVGYPDHSPPAPKRKEGTVLIVE